MCASLGDQVCGPHQKVRHPPESGWLDERGRLKGGHSGSSVVALWRAGRKAAGKALRPPPVCVVQGTTAYRRPTAPAVTFALFNRDWRGCDKGFQGNGQTSSSLTGRTSGLPFAQLDPRRLHPPLELEHLATIRRPATPTALRFSAISGSAFPRAEKSAGHVRALCRLRYSARMPH